MPKKRSRKRRYRKNPSVRGLAKRAGGLFKGLSFKSALHEMWMVQLGMFAAKWSAKRLGDAFPATQIDPESWNYATYLKGAAGATIAAMIANMVRPGSGQRVLSGGLNLMVYQAIQNELIVKSEFATGQLGFGADAPGMFIDQEGAPAMMSPDGTVLPLDESHRADGMLPAVGYGSYGDELVQPGPLGFGDELVAPGPLGSDPIDAYYEAFRQR